jgi:hypothetical protein
MSITIPHPETGEPVEVFVRIADSYVDVMCRAAYKSAWTAAATANGLIDADGNPVPGVNIDEIGDMIVTPATYDEFGNELTPAEIDHRFHVNFRIAEHLAWQPIALAWMLNGNDDAVPNKEEETRTLAKVSLIDPDTVKTPARVWF